MKYLSEEDEQFVAEDFQGPPGGEPPVRSSAGLAGVEYLRLCAEVEAGKAFGAIADYEAGTMTVWPLSLEGKALAVTFKMPTVKPANDPSSATADPNA